jgi:hypothetical protein
MSHEIELHDRVYSKEGTEWHGLAIHTPTNEEMVSAIESNLLFPILQGTPSLIMPDGSTIVLSEYQTIVADIGDRNEIDYSEDERYEDEDPEPEPERYVPLHTPKSSYRPISNREVYECVKQAIINTGATITTAGTLQNLKKFFISVDLGTGEMKAPNGDPHAAFLSFMTSHDGTMTFECVDSYIRIVCMNTFRATRFSGGNALNVSIPHTKNAGVQISNFGDYLNQVILSRQKVMEALGFLQENSASESEVENVLAGYFTEPERSEMTSQGFNRIEPLKVLFKKGIGNKGQTRYDLWNAFTEYYTSGDGAGGKKADGKKRLTAAQFGKAAQHKEDFLDILLNESVYQEIKERGEKLFRDATVNRK